MACRKNSKVNWLYGAVKIVTAFQILNIPSLGARDVLVVPAKQQVSVMLVGNYLLAATNMGNSYIA